MIEINVNIGDLSDVDLTTKPPVDKDLLTYDLAKSKWIPKAPTATEASTAYVLELNRWNVKNDGTEAVNTSKGINDALIWASQQGYVEVVLPKGTYLIDENKPIEPQSFMTLNLGGSTLRIRDNGLQKYAIVRYQRNQVFSRITNGRIEGDKDTHDYTTVSGTHEGGYGIEVGSFNSVADGGNNTRFISIDNLEIFNCTGDAITINSTFGQISPVPTVLANSFEQGGISTTDGALTTDTRKIRSTLKMDMNQPFINKYGYFGLYGNGYGALGSEITTNHYDLIFYKADESFLSAVTKVQFFDEVEVPVGASYAKVVLHQGNVPSSVGCTINVRVASFPQHVYIERCKLHHCRRQGISVSGAKHLYIRDCEIHHIKGTDPQGGIDIEDGYDLNQYIIIEGNNFHDNHGYDVIVVNGKYIYINKNRISTVSKYVALGLNRGVDKAVVSQNIIHNALVAFEGEAIFSNNQLYGSHMRISGDAKLSREVIVSNCMFNNSLLTLDKATPYQIKIDGCKFFNDVQKSNTYYSDKWCSVTLRKEPQIFSNCEFDGDDYYYLNNIFDGTKGGWIYDNVTFKNITKTFRMPAGIYTNCKFLSTASLAFNGGITTNAEYTFINCKFISNTTMNNAKTVRLTNCDLQQIDGTAIKIQNVSDEVILKGNRISYPNATKTNSIIMLENTFTGNLVVMEDNIISSSKTQVGIENLATDNQQVQVIVRNNILMNVTLKLGGRELNRDNVINGVIDPYYNMAAEPSTGYYGLGQEVRNSAPTPGGYIGWICTAAGYANNQSWTASKNYTKGSRINFGGHVYEAMNNGTSGTTLPIFPTVSGSTVMDHNMTWKEIGPLAVFKTFGSISA